MLREDSLREEEESVLVLGLSEDGLLQLRLDALVVDQLLNDDGLPELDSLTFSISMIWRREPSGMFGPA